MERNNVPLPCSAAQADVTRSALPRRPWKRRWRAAMTWDQMTWTDWMPPLNVMRRSPISVRQVSYRAVEPAPGRRGNADGYCSGAHEPLGCPAETWNLDRGAGRASAVRNLGKVNGGGRGIRTLDTVSRIHTFQACAFNHSATPPKSLSAGSSPQVRAAKRRGSPARIVRRRSVYLQMVTPGKKEVAGSWIRATLPARQKALH